jgi:hypothetical protein
MARLVGARKRRTTRRRNLEREVKGTLSSQLLYTLSIRDEGEVRSYICVAEGDALACVRLGCESVDALS